MKFSMRWVMKIPNVWIFCQYGWNPYFKQVHFFSYAKQYKTRIIFDTMTYQKLLKFQISFPLFKVSEPWKFQMSGFCISTGETHT